MLDVGWTELVVIAIVMIIVVGPKDLPPMLRTFGKMMSKMRGMATDFRHQFDEALKEADLDDVRKTLQDAQRLNPAHSLREAMNPLRQMGNDLKADLHKAANPDVKPVAPMPDSVDTPVPAVDIAASAALPTTQPVMVKTPAPVATPVEGPADLPKAKAKRVSKPKATPISVEVAEVLEAVAVVKPKRAPRKSAVVADALLGSAIDTGEALSPVRKTAARTRIKKGDA